MLEHMTEPLPQYMTTTEVAELLRTKTETVRFWRHVGKGPASFKVGRTVLYARDDVEAFIETARTEQRRGPDAA